VGNFGGLQRRPAQFTENAEQAEATLHELADRGLEHGIPSHGEPFDGASSAIGELLRSPA
jgi:hypothetical protein